MVNDYFNFLTDFGFKGPIEYNISWEQQYLYVKEDIVIAITFDGGFCVYFKKIKPKNKIDINQLDEYKELNFNAYTDFDLTLLDPNLEIYNAQNFDNPNEKTLSYYSKLFKDNPEILQGDLRKLQKTSIKSSIRKWLKGFA